MAAINVVSEASLFVSEPDPSWFGNPANPGLGQRQGWTNDNWLKSRFHFNFAEYDGGPSSFGVLRVMNDDLVQPGRGFGTHPHRDMEIMTFIVDGSLTHQDSMDRKETLGRGSIQFMTAGTGIKHSEHNLDKEAPLRFIQSWVVPRRRGLPPNYGSLVGDEAAAAARKDQWAHLVADAESTVPAPVLINQDCNVFVTELGPNAAGPPLMIEPSRQAYLLCVEGDAVLPGGTPVRRHDAAKLRGPLSLEAVAGPQGAMLLVFEMSSNS